MKKIAVLLLALCMVFALAGCVDSDDYDSDYTYDNGGYNDNDDDNYNNDYDDDNTAESAASYYPITVTKNNQNALAIGHIMVSGDVVSFSSDSSIFPDRTFTKEYRRNDNGFMVYDLYDEYGNYFSAIDEFTYVPSESVYGLRGIYEGNQWIIIYKEL